MSRQKIQTNAENTPVSAPPSASSTDWAGTESQASSFKDERLQKRFRRLLTGLHERMGGSIPYACQDWAAAKAAFRFLSNPKVSEAGILAGHFEATRAVKDIREGGETDRLIFYCQLAHLLDDHASAGHPAGGSHSGPAL